MVFTQSFVHPPRPASPPQIPEIILWFLAADFATLGYLIGVPLIQMDKEKPLGSMAESDKGKPKSEAG